MGWLGSRVCLADGGDGRGNVLHHVKKEGNCPGEMSEGDVRWEMSGEICPRGNIQRKCLTLHLQDCAYIATEMLATKFYSCRQTP